MKIIATDNFNRENMAERAVAVSIEDTVEAKAMCDALNNMSARGHWFYVVKPDDYKLWRGMEELA